MNDRLSSTVNDLERLGFSFRVIDLGGPAVRTRDVIAREGLDVNPDEIVKTVMLKSKLRGVFAVALRGTDRISYRKVKSLLGDKQVSTLRPEEMLVLGWEPGECCPLSVPGPLYVDESLFSLATINTGSGDLCYGLEFPVEALRALRDDVQVVDIKE